MDTPQHCPGYASFKQLKAFTCRCEGCGQEKEIFSDEFDRPHACSKCGKPLDLASCKLTGEAGGVSA
jgi:rRNA maturation endonuclease Nob1